MAEDSAAIHADSLVAVKNALKLGASLLLTWSVSLGIKLVLPRVLGPEMFGVISYAEAFAATWFVATGFGIDTYVRKEVPVKPEHAREFFGSVYMLRLAVSVVLLAVMALVGKHVWLVVGFGIGQFFFTTNNTYAALLHAIGKVNDVAVLNVVSKVIWGTGILLGFAVGQAMISVAFAFAASEAVKAVWLRRVCLREFPGLWRMDRKALATVVVASLPFFLTQLSTTLSSRIDMTILSYLTNDKEVGLYGAASNLAGLALLLTPLIGWVLLPLSSRAAARGELATVTKRSLELILTLATPVSLILCLDADVIVAIVFGPSFAHAVPALRVLSAMFVLTYAAMVANTHLVRVEKSWFCTWVTLFGVGVQVVLNFLLIPLFRYEGGGGLASAVSVIGVEAAITLTFVLAVGRDAFDARGVRALAKTALVAVAVTGLHLWMANIFLDVFAYVLLAVTIGAINVRELYSFVSQSRKAAHA